MDTLSPIDANKITRKDRAKALASLVLLTENIYGQIKRKICGNGRKQRSHIKIEDVAYPMVSLEYLKIT